MKHLSQFIHSIDLIRARPLPTLATEVPNHIVESTFGVANEDFSIYLADARERHAGVGQTIQGTAAVDLPHAQPHAPLAPSPRMRGQGWGEGSSSSQVRESTQHLPSPADFAMQFYSPTTGLYSSPIEITGGPQRITLPPFTHDLVLRFKRQGLQ
jgi:hypothetical protein